MKKNNLEYTETLAINKNAPRTNRILIFTPTRGLVRMEWVCARYGQIIPTNWSHTEMLQPMSSFVASEYLLPDAENLMAKAVVEGDYEWCISLEDDNIIPPDAFLRMNEYMIEKKVPIVSGIYFTKGNFPEPIIYRGRGTGSFQDWKLGEKVWVDGIPFGFTLMHGSIIKALWNESPEYMVDGQKTRRVFALPNSFAFDPQSEEFAKHVGTTDLAWCSRLMEDNIFEKAGWPEYQKMQYPFLVDTNIVVGHIDQQGRVHPMNGIPQKYKA